MRGFAATNTSVSGGGIYEDIPFAVSAGQSFCASPEVVTVGATKNAAGSMALWLLGGGTDVNSSITFSGLAGQNHWKPVGTCITAAAAHNSIRIQFYVTPNTPTLGIDAVDVK